MSFSVLNCCTCTPPRTVRPFLAFDAPLPGKILPFIAAVSVIVPFPNRSHPGVLRGGTPFVVALWQMACESLRLFLLLCIENDFPCFHNVAAVGNLQSLGSILFNQKNRGLPGIDFLDRLEKGPDHQGGQP